MTKCGTLDLDPRVGRQNVEPVTRLARGRMGRRMAHRGGAGASAQYFLGVRQPLCQAAHHGAVADPPPGA